MAPAAFAVVSMLLAPVSGSFMRDCCVGQHWIIGVPPVDYQPLWSFTADESGDASSGDTTRRLAELPTDDSSSDTARRRLAEMPTGEWGGFAIEVLEKLSLTMGFTYSLTAAPPYSSGDDTDGVTARMLLNYGMADFLMVPASNPANQLDTRIYQTVPYHNSYYSLSLIHI